MNHPFHRSLFKPWACAALLSALPWTVCLAEPKAPAIDAFSERLSTCFASIDQADRDSFKRQAAMAKTLTGDAAAAFDAEEEASLQALDGECRGALARQLASALHATVPKGFDSTPVLNLETLRARFYRLPPPVGLKYRATMGDDVVFMTHEQLLAAWLKRPRPQVSERMDRVDTALDSGAFYATVFSDYVPARVLTRVPFQSPADTTAAALLITESATAAVPPPVTLVVALIRDGLVVVGATPWTSELPLGPACSTPQSKHRLAKATHDDKPRLLRACHTRAWAGTPEQAQATREAQAFVDRLTAAFANR